MSLSKISSEAMQAIESIVGKKTLTKSQFKQVTSVVNTALYKAFQEEHKDSDPFYSHMPMTDKAHQYARAEMQKGKALASYLLSMR